MALKIGGKTLAHPSVNQTSSMASRGGDEAGMRSPAGHPWTHLIEGILHPHYYDDDDKNRRNGILSFTTYACLLIFAALLCIHAIAREYTIVLPFACCCVMLALTLVLIQTRHLAAASLVLILTLFALVAYLATMHDGIHDTALFGLPGILIIAGLVLEKKQYYGAPALTVAWIAALIVLERMGLYRNRFSGVSTVIDGFDIIILLTIIVVGIRILTNELIKSLDRARKDEVMLRASDARLQTLLAERELMLKEVHHRIKNNMNIMAAILRLQSSEERETCASASLSDAASRLDSMMFLYDKLYRSELNGSLSLAAYLPTLTAEIAGTFSGKGSVKVETQVEDVILNAKVLSYLGIIVNELVTNAMKHAFAEGPAGRILVSASREGSRVSLSVVDDGVGLPAGFSFAESKGFGSRLVAMLVEQIGGRLRIDASRGTKVLIDFEA